MRKLIFALVLLCAAIPLYGQGVTVPSAQQCFFDTTGHPLGNGQLNTYNAGTTTPKPTYSDQTGTVPLPNPVILDAAGCKQIWWAIGSSYKVVANNSFGALQWTIDGVAFFGGPGAGYPLSSLTNAVTNNNLNNASFTQQWNWALTGGANGMIFGETSAGAGTGAVVQINGLSNAVTPLDVIGQTGSPIHFGSAALKGGWLNAPPGNPDSIILSAGASNSQGAWTARANTSATLQLNNAANAGGFIFSGTTTGQTPGSTFTPTTIGILAPAGLSSVASINTPGNTTTGSLNVTGNSQTNGTDQSTHLSVTGGVYNSGAGLKHQRFTSCTTPATANGACAFTFTWSIAFPDAQYTASCSLDNINTAFLLNTYSKTAASMQVGIMNVPGSTTAATGIVNCIAMHD